MKFDTKYIIIIAILGIILLYSYYYFAKNTENVNKLWGRIKGKLLNIYYISMILSAIGFLLLFYYLIISNSFTENQVYRLLITLLLIVVVSMIWMPLSIYYLKNKKNLYKILIYIVLFVVAISSLALIITLNEIKENKLIFYKNLAMIGMIYFFIHAFFFDFLIWTHNFF
jgi:hypothetical protein